MILDKTFGGLHVGCPLLRRKVEEIEPRLHFFGHIHETYGVHVENNTTFVNASVMDLRYRMVNKPVTIFLDTESKENVEVKK